MIGMTDARWPFRAMRGRRVWRGATCDEQLHGNYKPWRKPRGLRIFLGAKTSGPAW